MLLKNLIGIVESRMNSREITVPFDSNLPIRGNAKKLATAYQIWLRLYGTRLVTRHAGETVYLNDDLCSTVSPRFVVI